MMMMLLSNAIHFDSYYRFSFELHDYSARIIAFIIFPASDFLRIRKTFKIIIANETKNECIIIIETVELVRTK